MAKAQFTPDDQAGLNSFQSYHSSDLDSVNLATGNLVLHIPLLSYPQRGNALKVDYQLLFNGKMVQQQQVCSWPDETCTPQRVILGQIPAGGTPVYPHGVYAIETHGAVLGSKNITFYDPDKTIYKYNTSIRTIYDSDGSAHILGNVGTTNKPPTGGSIIESGPWRALDGSGWVLQTDGTIGNSNGVAYKSGNQTDTNGNQISSTVSGITDTLGRQIAFPPTPSSASNTDASGCTGPLPITSSVLWTPSSFGGGNASYKFCYATVTVKPGYTPGATWNVVMLQSIVLPNLTTWTFEYSDRNSGDAGSINYGSLTKITLPTGGTTSYTYADYLTQTESFVSPLTASDIATTSRGIATRTVTDQTGSHTWTYAGGTVTDPNGNDTVHQFTSPDPTTGAAYETGVLAYKGSASANLLLRNVQTAYTTPSVTTFQGSVNYLPLTRTTTLDNGQVMKEVYQYDPGFTFKETRGSKSFPANYGKITSTTIYDYAKTAPPTVVLKTTQTSYLWQSNSTYLSANMLNLPSSVVVSNGSGYKCAETDYAYDDPNRLSTPSPAVTTQHVAPPWSVRGNLSSIARQLSSTPCQSGAAWSPISAYKNVYDTGEVYQSVDPYIGTSSSTTTYAYSSSYAGALPTTITNALSQSGTKAYDFNTGALTSATDPNQLTTSYSYDSMWRLSQANHPDGGLDTITRQEATAPFTATLTSTIDTSHNKIPLSVFDGLGRVSQTQLTSDPQGIAYTDTTYDALGRVGAVSNPYRNGADASSSPGTTTYTYDALGRKIKEAYPDGSALTTAYCGPNTLVTDPTGKWRRSRVNGLGQLVEVDEPNAVGAVVAANGCPGTGEPIWVTAYTNDALGNLKQVVQNGSHQRNFTYDSLSRLLTSTNPETGTITYTYNPDSTVATKKDARAITTTYSYDALHRETGISYSNGDPSLSFTYDQANCLGLSLCHNIGHRTSMTDGAGSEAWAYQVDKPNSRSIHREQRTIISSPTNITKTTTYYLDLAGNVTQLVYPTGRTVNYTHDSADRPSSATDASSGITYVTDWKTPPAGTTCATGAVCYTPHGSVYGMSIGQSSSFTGLNILETFSSRLQPNEIKASSSAGTAIDITYNFVDPTTSKNAGHVYAITNNLTSGRSQQFTYDQVNRIVSAGTTATTGSACWGYKYSFDAWGNLLSQAGWSPTYNGCTETTMSGVTADGNNHISGLSYDTSGNTLNDGNYSYTWDGESQLKTAGGVTYAYDGDGRRAAKSGSKLYWYGSGGEILAETDAAGNTQNEYVYFGGKRIALVPATGNPLYYAEDLLGSSRVMVQSNGTVCYDADFTPFGGEKAITSTCAQNYKFEGKERDAETQNDDFGAREYSWRYGRWLSSDWSAVPVAVPYANLTNPQTLNLYSMVADDPESFADLDGHKVDLNGTPEDKAEELRRLAANAPRTDKNGVEESSLFKEKTDKNGNTTVVLDKAAAAKYDGSHSQGFKDIVQTIDHKDVVSVKLVSTDDNVTHSDGGGHFTVSLARNQTALDRIVPLRNGNPLEVIAGHEILGHARLGMLGTPNANRDGPGSPTFQYENRVLRPELNLGPRLDSEP